MSDNDHPAGTAANTAEELIASPEVARAIENDEFRPILDHFPIAIALARLEGAHHRVCYVNAAFVALTESGSVVLNGHDWTPLERFRHETETARTLATAVQEAEDFLGRFIAEQSAKSVEAYAGVIESEDSGRTYRIVALVDVTGRDRIEADSFHKTVADKDMLLRELQHRVRNNLQMVVALIRLEARQYRRGDTIDFDRLAHRVEALSILYASLSDESGESRADLATYIGQIANAVMQGHGPDGVRMELKLESCVVPMRTAMSIGLVVNELVTNAFKYAFPDGKGGTLTIRCERKGDECFIGVADDGVGLAEGAAWPVVGKIGDLMVRSLRETTKGEFRAVSSPGKGLSASISFKAPDGQPK